jgi:hypothetical protein
MRGTGDGGACMVVDASLRGAVGVCLVGGDVGGGRGTGGVCGVDVLVMGVWRAFVFVV